MLAKVLSWGQRGSIPLSLFVTVFVLTTGEAQILVQTPRERTLDEIKEESIARAERGGYPLIGLDPADVREAFQSITSLDKDQWAAAWIAIGDRYYARAQGVGASNPAEAASDYLRAWRLYSFGRWPVPSSPGKLRAYNKALAAFLAAAKFLDPPLEVVRIPF